MKQRLDAISDILAQNELPISWRTIIGDPEGAERPNHDDTAWSEGWKTLDNHRWDTAWLRAHIPHCPLITGEVQGTTLSGGFITVWLDDEQIGEGFDPTFQLPTTTTGGKRVLAIRSQQGELSSEHEHLILWDSERLREIQHARRSLDFVRAWREARPQEADTIDPVLQRYADAVDPDMYDGAPSVFWEDVVAATELLRELDTLAKKYRVHIVPHSHVDLAWGWTYSETKRLARAMFDMALRLMDEEPEYTFIQDQPPMYEHQEGSAIEAAVAKRISEGRWDVPGASYGEPESFMTGGESWVRQFMYTKRYFKSRFDKDVTVHWAPDNFSGHTNTLPQILRKCGIEYFAFGNWYQANHGGQFLWEGLDGSQVFAHYFTAHYDSAQMLDQDKVIKSICSHMSSSDFDDFMLLDGDDLTPPWPESPSGVRALRELAASPGIEFSTPHRFFDTVESGRDGLRVEKGEFISTVHHRHNNVGAYTSFVEVKRRNRQLEWMLRTTEALATMASQSGYDYPADRFEHAWKRVLFNQMHDIFPGTAIHEEYVDTHRRYDEAESTCIDITEHAVNTLGRDIDTSGEGIPLVLFNTLGCERNDPAEVILTEAHSYLEGFEVVDGDGNDVPAQILESSIGTFDKTNKTYRLLVQPESVPAMGHRTVWLRPTYVESALFSSSMVGPDGLTLDNDHVRVQINPRTGWVAELIDKRLGHNVLPDGREACALELQPDMGNPWHLAPEGPTAIANESVQTEVIEDGDVRAAIRVTTTSHDSVFVQNYRIYRNSPRLEVRSRVEFNTADHVLKALIPVALPAEARWTCEVPWGAVEREIPDNDRAVQTWMDVDGTDATGRQWGVAVLNNGRYGHSRREDGTLTLTLIRSVCAHKSTQQTDAGVHEVTYAIMPHAGKWEDSDIVQAGHMLNSPIIASRETPHSGTIGHTGGALSVDAPNIVIASMKRAEDDDSMVIHAYETTGKATDAVFTFDRTIATAEEIDLVEMEPGTPMDTDGATIRRSFSPWKIASMKVRLT
jgi:alpha-mannosidase